MVIDLTLDDEDEPPPLIIDMSSDDVDYDSDSEYFEIIAPAIILPPADVKPASFDVDAYLAGTTKRSLAWGSPRKGNLFVS